MSSYDYSLIPNEMKNEKRWVLWKKENGTKLPLNAKNGNLAQSNNEKTWSDFNFANQVFTKQLIKCDGLGFMLGGDFVGIDIDFKSEKENDFNNVKNDILNAINSYTEYSQSGKGIHIICKGVLPKGSRRKNFLEMYDSGRFFALTGNVYQNRNEIFYREKELTDIYNKYLGNQTTQNTYSYTFVKDRDYEYSLTDDEIINKALKSKNKGKFSLLWNGEWEGVYESHSHADLAFASFLAFWSNKDKTQMDRIFRKSGLMREKWDRKQSGTTYGSIVLDKAIEGCKETYSTLPKNNSVENIQYDSETGEVRLNKRYDLSDTGNAKRFFDLYGDNIKYNFTNKMWLIFDGKTWLNDNSEQVKKFTNLMIDKMQKELENINDKEYQVVFAKNLKHLSSTSGKEAMLKEFKHLVPISNNELDTQDYYLNCKNGVVDLRNGLILPHNKDYFMSKNTNCEVSFDTPTLWLKTLNDIFENNAELINYIQLALGYTLTGYIKEQILFECIGNGSNGKSVLFNTIYKMLGDYSVNIQIESILTKTFSSSGNASPDIAKLSGARFVRTNEPSENARFNEGLVKQLTGGDVITARFLYGNEFDFTAKFKLWIACNNKIIIRGNDNGIWRRIRLIAFNRQFDEKDADKDLEIKLLGELPQILGWCVKGAIKYFENGLITPDIVIQAVNEYKKEMDLVAKFIEEKCSINAKYKIKSSDLYNEYKTWAKITNEWEMNATRFGREISKKFEKIRIGGGIYYKGIDLLVKHQGYVYESE